MSDAPTQRFETPGGAPEPAPEKRNRALLVALLVIGGLLLIGIVVVVLLLIFGRGTPAAVPSGSPSTIISSPSSAPRTPSPTPSATATQGTGGGSNGGGTGGGGGDDGSVQITAYSISPTRADCSGGTTEVPLTIRWASRNGVHAYFGVDAGGDPQHPGDANANGMGWVLPPNGSNADFPDGNATYAFPCGDTSQRYTITVEGPSGTQSRLIEVTRAP